MARVGMSSAEATTLQAPELLDVVSWIDARARDATGRRLGRVKAVVADAQGTPWWIVLRHRGRDVVAPVSAVCDARHREIRLDRPVEALAACPAEIDQGAHDALVDRFGLASPDSVAEPRAPRGPRDACTPRARRRFRRRSA